MLSERERPAVCLPLFFIEYHKAFFTDKRDLYREDFDRAPFYKVVKLNACLYPHGARLNTHHSEYEIMSRAHDLFRPDGLKLLLGATLIVPVFFLIVLVTGFPFSDMVFPAAITLVVSYLAACVIDDAIQSRTTKILIASAAAVVSIILGYLLIRSMSVVCDPVHDPGTIVCDPVHVPEPATPGPTVIATVRPATTAPMIFDPVHEPNSCGGNVCQVTPGIVSGIVAEKLEECRKKL